MPGQAKLKWWIDSIWLQSTMLTFWAFSPIPSARTLLGDSHTIPSIVWKSWQIFQGFFPTHWLQKVASTFRLGHCKYMKAFRGIFFIVLYWIIVSFWKSFSPLDSKEKMHLQKYTVFSEMFIHFLMYQFFEIFTVFTYKVLGRKFDSYKCYLHILKLEVYDTS